MNVAWTIIRAFIDTGLLPVSYVDVDAAYWIFVSNGGLSLQCRIIQDGGSDQIDFETNYKSTANQAPTQASVVQEESTTTGSLGSLSAALSIDCSNDATVRLYIAGTWLGTISFYGTTNGVDFDPIYGLDVSGAPTQNTSASTTDSFTAWKFDVTGYASLSIEMTAYTAGTADLTAIGSKHSSVLSGMITPSTINGTVCIRDSSNSVISVGQQDMNGSVSVVIADNQTPIPVSVLSSDAITIDNGDGAASVNIQDGGNSITVDGTVAATQSGTWNITNVSGTVSLPTGAATSALQTQPGVDIGDVTINNSSGGSAVNIQDGGNSITVDNNGTFVTQSTLAAETTKVIGTVNISSGQSVALAAGSAVVGHVINDAGSAIIGKVGIDQTTPGTTNGVQVNAALPAGSNAIGKLAANSGVTIGAVEIAASQTVGIASGSAQIGHLEANQSVNIAQINGVTTTMGNGASGTGVQRVTIANDSTGIIALTTGSSQIGHLEANQSVNNSQVNGVTVSTGNGVSGTGVQRVTLASDSTGIVALTTGSAQIGHLEANQSVNNAQVNGSAMVTSVTGVQDVTPRKRTGATGLSPNYSASRITSKTTTTVTAATAYVSAIVFACSAAGTAWTFVVQNKEGTPKILVPSITLTVPVAGPVIMQFAEPILMTSGIDIVTGGTTAGTVDVFVTYWQ